MQKNNELLVKEGLLYDEFVIKGDNDYIELCDHIMIKYNEMHDKYNKLLDSYKKCTIDLAKLKKKRKNEVSHIDLIEDYYNDKLNFLIKKDKMLTKRECIMQNRKNKMIKHHQYLLKLKEELKNKEMKINYNQDYNISLAKELKRCRFRNRVLRIKLLKLKKELSRKNI